MLSINGNAHRFDIDAQTATPLLWVLRDSFVAQVAEVSVHDNATFSVDRVVQSNFHDYTVFRIEQLPSVEVHIVKSAQAPSGVGESATPVVAPAVANALYDATGQRFSSQPLKLSG
jgi:CO/xanthine dehydrogenase Mo-binding subunit